MRKKTREMLKGCSISVKWKNFDSWVKEEFTTLLEYVDSKNVKIYTNRKFGAGHLIIKCIFGNQVIKKFSSTAELEHDLYTLIAQNCLYLGDQYRIITRLKNWNI